MCRKGGICFARTHPNQCACPISTHVNKPESDPTFRPNSDTRAKRPGPRTSSIERQLAEQGRKDAKRVRASLLLQSCEALPRDQKC